MIAHRMRALWKNFQSGMQDLRMSRWRRNDNSHSRFRDIENRKCSHRFRGCRPRIRRRYNQLKKGTFGSVASKDPKRQRVSELTNVSKIDWLTWKEMGTEASPASSTTRSRSDQATMVPQSSGGERDDQATKVAESSRGEMDDRECEIRPVSLHPLVKLATLSSLLKTLSDRYARRTGKLTPLHVSRQPLLTSTLSESPWVETRSRDVNAALKRYENPYQQYLKRTFTERKFSIVNRHANYGGGAFWSIS